MPIYTTTDGRRFYQNDSLAEQFEREVSDATIEMYVDGRVADVPLSRKADFLAKYPNATTSYQQPSKVIKTAEFTSTPTASHAPEDFLDADLRDPAQVEQKQLEEREAEFKRDINRFGVDNIPSTQQPQQPAPVEQPQKTSLASLVPGPMGTINSLYRSGANTPTPEAEQPAIDDTDVYGEEVDTTDYAVGFGEGVKEGWKGLVAGTHYFGGELANAITGTSRDDWQALQELQRRYYEGESLMRDEVPGWKKAWMKYVNFNSLIPESAKKGYRQILESDNINSLINDALVAANGDVTQARKILAEQSLKETWGDRQIEEAGEKLETIRPTKGFGAWAGNLIPQMIPTAAALGAGFLTKNPKVAQTIGQFGMGAMIASTAGMSMKEARDAGATNGEVWAAGIADGVIEYVCEKIPFDIYIRKIAKNMATSTSSDIIRLLGDPKSPAKDELEKLVVETNKRLGGKLLSGRNVKEYLTSVAAEGLSEFSAEALQIMTPIIYEDPENYPALWDALKNGFEGFKAGIFMGAIMGGGSKAMEHQQQRSRRKQQGYVAVAQIDTDNGSSIGEVVGDKDGKIIALVDGDFIEVAPEKVGTVYEVPFEAFDKGVGEYEIEESYENGYTLQTPQEKNDAMTMKEEQRKRVIEIMHLPEDTDLDEYLGDDPLRTILMMEEGTTQGERQALLDYVNAASTVDGMYQAVRDDIDGKIAQSDAQVDSRISQTDGRIHPATMRQDDRAVYIMSGDVVLLDDGTIDTANSSESIIVKDAETGKMEFSDPASLLNVGEVADAEQTKEALREQIRQSVAGQAEAEILGTLAFAQGDTYVLTDEEGVQHQAQIVADNGDGTVQVALDGATEAVQMPKEQVQAMNDATNRGRAAAYIEQQNAQRESAMQEVAEEQQPIEEPPIEQPQVEESALSRIPTDEEGNQLFEQAPAKDTWSALVELNEGDMTEATDTAQQMLDNAKKDLDEAMNVKPKGGATVAEIQQDKAERKARIAEAQQKVDYWTEVLNAQQAAQEQAAQEVAAQTQPATEQTEQETQAEAVPTQEQTEQEEQKQRKQQRVRIKVKKDEEARRKPLRKRAQAWANKVGVEAVLIERFEDVENESARKAIQMHEEQKSGQRIPGWYTGGKVYIYLPHATDISDLDQTYIHEVVAHHGMKQMLGEEGYKQFCLKVWDMMEQTLNERELNRWLAYQGVKGDKAKAADEYIAHLAETTESLTELDQSVWDKIVELIRDALRQLGVSLEGDSVAFDPSVEFTNKLIVDALHASKRNLEQSANNQSESKQAEGADDINEKDGDAIFSIRTYEESGRANLKKFLKGQVKKKRITKADAEAIESTMEQMYETALQYKDVYAPFGAWSEAEVVKGKDGRPAFSVVKDNGEYVMNLDFSTVCKKRRTLDAVFSEMISRGLIDMIPMDGVQIAEINNIIRDYGFETACALCFVDAKRFRVAKVADKFCEMWNPMTKMSEEELRGVIKEYGDKKVIGKVAKYIMAHPEGRIELSRENLIDSKGFERMQIDHPEILSLYKQAQGTSLAKIPFGDVQYLNDIEDRAWTPDAAYAVGGVRLQSFSDYIPRMFFDYMQMIAGLASKKLPVHAYTKEPIFAKQFGLTGIKINLSLVPKVVEGGVAAGLDAEGNYAWMEGETFPFEEAMALQNAEGYRENCGTIAVGVSDEHIEKMLDDPNIRMIIPYHKSNINPLVAKKNNIHLFKDYTLEQNTRNAEGKSLGARDKADMPNFNSLMHDEGMDARQAAQAYLDWCDSKGFIPKFDKWRDHPNYYKLLEDFTSIVPNAEGVETTYPQREVTMTFPNEDAAFGSIDMLIREGLEEDAVLEGQREEKIVEIVDTIEKEMVRFRITYHGTPAIFERFDHSFMGSGEGNQAFGWGTYVTEEKGIGEWYAKVLTAPINEFIPERRAIIDALIELDKAEQFAERLREEIQYAKDNIAFYEEQIRNGATGYELEDAQESIEHSKEGTLYNEQALTNAEAKIESARAAVAQAQEVYERARVRGNVYQVEIPDDNGYNYLSWEGRLTPKQMQMIASQAEKEGLTDLFYRDEDSGELVFNGSMTNGEFEYKDLERSLGSDKAASEFLSRAGFTGIKYFGDGGNQDVHNYVIFNDADLEIKERTSFRTAPTFLSNAAVALEGIKQEKATPQQWLAMLKKAGGIKAGEDKWIGLSEWLEQSEAKTLTKQEVADYINENQIQIEEVAYSETNAELLDRVGELEIDLENIDGSIISLIEDIEKGKEHLKRLTDEKREFDEKGEALKREYGEDSPEYQNHIFYDSYTESIKDLKTLISDDERFYQIQSERADAIRSELEDLKAKVGAERVIDETRLGYTTDGLDNKREIALTIPTIESWNETDKVHFGDAGEGRAIAWIRFGETTDEDGKRVLVIDEIQSKRHQEGREKGYRPSDVDKYLKDNNVDVVETGEFYEFYRDGELDRRFSKGLLHYNIKEAKNLYVAGYNKSNVPDAPFEKNWAELAMKRMLRYAAEHGFDKVAWTKGDQQAERYNIGNVVTRILSYEGQDNGQEVKHVEIHLTDRSRRRMTIDNNGVVVSSEEDFVNAGTPFADVVGKEVARKVLNGEGEDATLVLRESTEGVGDAIMQLMKKYGVSRPADLYAVISAEDKATLDAYHTQKEVTAKEIDADGLRIGGEGMRAFYDQMLPSFMRKYAKKWGATVQDVTLPNVEEAGRTMHSVDVTDSMRESVMQGQTMFRVSSSRKAVERYDKENGTNVKGFFEFLRGGKVFEEGKPTTFHIANAGDLLAQYGIKGKFIVGKFTFSRSHTQDADHELGVKEWVDIINNLNTPLAITSYKGLPNQYRIYTYATINGKNICVGVNVSLDGDSIELSNIISAYGRDINNLLGKEGANLLYPDLYELKQRISQVSTAPNSLLNATSSASGANIQQGTENSNDEGKKIIDAADPNRYMFIGEQGARQLDAVEEATTRLDNLEVAKEMEAANKGPRTIKMATGWERGADGKWRYETLDGIDTQAIANITEGEYTLEDFVLDESLFDAYPSLRGVKVVVEPNTGQDYGGYWDAANNTIALVNYNDGGEYEQLGIIHEIQHAIQRKEGFTMGINPKSAMPISEEKIDQMNALRSAIRYTQHFGDVNLASLIHDDKKYGGYIWNTLSQETKDILTQLAYGRKKMSPQEAYNVLNARWNKLIQKELVGEARYRRQAGEVEARNSAARRGMSLEERRAFLGSETEDVAREDQLFIYDNIGSKNTIGQTAQMVGQDLATRVNLVERIEDITDPNPKIQERKRKARGWYDTESGEVFVVLPNVKSGQEARRTVFHEVVGHKGVRETVGEKRYNAFLEKVYRGASPAIRERIARHAATLGWDFNLATDEYLASLAEQGFEERENRNFFEVVRDLFLDLLSNAKIALGYRINDNDIRYMLWRTYQMQRSKGAMGIAEDVVMQQRLGVGEFDTRFRVAEDGNQIGDGSYHVPYRVDEIALSYPNVTYTINESATTESVYVTYYNNDPKYSLIDRPKVTVRFSNHESNAVSYGYQLAGTMDASEQSTNRLLARLDLKKAVPIYGKSVPTFSASNADLEAGKYDEADITKAELYSLPIGTDISQHRGKLIKGTREVINTDKIGQSQRVVGYRYEDIPEVEAKREEQQTSFRETTSPSDDVRMRVAHTPYRETLIRQQYEERIKSGMYQSMEAMQDSMQSLHDTMLMILKEEGYGDMYIEDVASFENAYIGENRLSSTNLAEANAFANTVFQRLVDAIAAIAPNEEARTELIDYMFAKHGLERNEKMAERDAKREYDQQENRIAAKAISASGAKTMAELIAEKRQKDYAGLTALTGKKHVSDAEKEAQRMVEEYENSHETDEIWERVQEVRKAILSKLYEGGLLSKEQMEQILDMYDYYIPLRGFDEKTVTDQYAYLTSTGGSFSSPIRKAGGRESKADDPFANLSAMAESAILQANRNMLVKQRFLNFVLRHPSDLVSVNRLWLRYDETNQEWVPEMPNILETDSPDEVARKVAEHEQAMKELSKAYPDRYKVSGDQASMPYKVPSKETLKEHQVIVKRNGVDYVLTINGSPRLAQALNGLTNPDNDISGAIGAVLDAAQWVNRALSAAYTTRNPDFLLSNFMRDMLYTNSMVWIKESPNYALTFHKNYLKANPAQMKILYSKYNEGTLDMSDPMEAMFYKFIINGGETGYVNLKDVEQHKSELKEKLARSGGKLSVKEGLQILGDRLDGVNQAVENCARFAAFMTSQQMGRSLDRSIYDAKEISVNFNKKGAGSKFMGANGQTALGNAAAFTSGLGRSMYLFWNAAIQGTTNLGRQVKRHPAKAFTALASWFILGALMAYLGYDDDDEDAKNSYFNNPENVRRSNIMFHLGDGYFAKIPLSVEYRAAYGLGELMVSVMSGKEDYSDGELASAIVGQMTQILPIDFMEGQGGSHAFIPSAVKPVTEIVSNTSWTGLPIYKDTPYNKDMPNWTKAYSGTNKYLVNLAATLNELSGGDKYTKGAIDLNPANIEYLLNGYFGGYFATADKLTKTAEMVVGARDFDPRGVLFLNRVLAKSDDRTQYRAVNNKYYEAKKEYETTKRRLRNYEHDTDEGIFNFAEKIDFLYNSEAYRRMELFDIYRGDIEDLEREIKEATSDEEKEALNAELMTLKSLTVDAIYGTEEEDNNENR